MTDTDAESAQSLTLTRTFDAPRLLVWKAWTDPARLVRWFFPAGCSLLDPRFDVRPGGAYRCGYRGEDGAEFWLRGRFLDLHEPERLVFTFGWENPEGTVDHDTRVTVTLAEDGAGTRLTLHQATFLTAEDRAAHAEGWGQALDHLTAHLGT